ncbi:hypothetical protein BGZ75_006840 [Mortierella antarctica]|nr:hypothetical protein BGZ75_006840 [Mortierella antarctica]
MTSSSTVSIIGLGAMGLALAAKFVEKGYTTTVWNRSTEKALKFAAEHENAHAATTVAQGLEASNLVIICLLDNKAVRDTIDQALPSLAGRIVVNLTNGTPDEGRETGALVAAQEGSKYVHGGIMATPSMVGSPASVLLYSGSLEAYTAVEKDLEILGAGKYLGADSGSASLHDLALLSGMYGLFSGFTHAVSLVRNEKRSTTEFLSLLVPWLTAMTGYLHVLGKQIDEGDFSSLGSSIEMQVPAINNIVKTSEAQGVSADLIRPIQGLLERAVAVGRGGEEISALVGLNVLARKAE